MRESGRSGGRMVRIRAGKGNGGLGLKEVWDYRDLVILFTKRTFLLAYKQTILGPLWLVLNPLLTSGIYTVVFGRIAGIQTAGVPKPLFYLCGTALWGFFSACVQKNARTFLANSYLFGKVYFPRMTVPVSEVLASGIRLLIQMGLVAALLIYYAAAGRVKPVYGAWILLPVIVLQLGIMGMSVGVWVSSLTTRYRDLSVLVGFGLNLWMYATPVVYPLSQLKDGWLRCAVLANPVTAPVELFRYALLGAGSFEPLAYAGSWLFTILLAVWGIRIFNHVEKTFLDTI